MPAWYHISNPTSLVQVMIDSSVPRFPSPQDVCKMELATSERSVLTSPGDDEQSCNPELVSRMHLIILELWVALDQAAIKSFPLLQDYDPGIPLEPYHSLLLASWGVWKDSHAPKDTCASDETTQRLNVLRPSFGFFGHHRSLAVRYFAIWEELQKLEHEIVDKASDERAGRLEELSRLRSEGKDLIKLYKEGVCERVAMQGELWMHPDTCVRCSYQDKANKMEILTHYYPLPTDTHQAQGVIFELAVPNDIGEWRDITIYLIRDVLQCGTLLTPPAERPTRLRAYRTLTRYFRSNKEWRVSLQSTHIYHPSAASIPNCTSEAVLISNNLRLDYFDDHRGVFFSDPIPSHAHSESCSLPRPKRLQMALTTLSSGQDGTLWIKMLSQLTMPKINLNRQEIAIFVIHLSLRAGPNSQETMTRKTHVLLSDVNFGRKMLNCLGALVARVEEDSGSYYALCAFTSLAARLLSMTEVLKPEYTQLPGYCRTVSHHWMLQAREKVHTMANRSDWLDLAIVGNWPAFTPGANWCKASRPQPATWEHLWVSTVSDQLTVHFNLRIGQLLVDELPLSRLTPEYQQHPCCKRIFGSLVMDVIPSPLRGMRFSSKRMVAGQSLHFGMPPTTQGNASSDLLVRLRDGGSRQDLIPSRVFAGILPHSFVHDFVHWYHHDSQIVELRRLFRPWHSDPDNWRLTEYNQVWRLTKGGNYSLVAPSSRIGQVLAKTLFSLHNDSSPMQLVFNTKTPALETGMPQLGLSFELKPFDTAIRCHQFPWMKVDMNQSTGTLVGFTSRLVLRDNQQPQNRRLIIPEGSIQWEGVSYGSFEEHVKASVVPGTFSRVQSYALPKVSGQLEGYVPLQSKLYLAFLHALTSHCAPDLLLGRTGTEEAVSILESAEIRSTNYLLVHSLIEETRSKVSILPIQSAEATGFVDSDTQLVNRRISRHSDFQVTGSAPNNFTTAHDVFCTSRGVGQLSPRSVLASEIASMVYHDQQFLVQEPATNLTEGLYKLLNTDQEGLDISQLLTPQKMEFDSRWLQHPSKNLLA
ncbi:hypothetical protein B0J13DRAFT_520555 [Dactylonectria estremocensis]|uniref:Uncharacterized protein n=1 Tax=Dactylonectria estremocensis TaxID=1079267 RepID=A0A9P9F9M0_9HYPO|nr:hypothetical protein B0J13DRAFT_520555 [Dactylonectria estremocensis]